MKLTTAVAALVGLTLAAPAFAQREPTGLAFEIGGNYIMKSEVRDSVGDVGLRLALNYQLPTQSLLGPTTGGKPSATLSYTWADDDVKLTTWGLSYEERVPFTLSAGPTGPYWGLGLGVFRSKAEWDVSYSEMAAESGPSETKTRFGGRALLGMDFTKYYAELSYNLSGKVADGKTDSIALAAGIRF